MTGVHRVRIFDDADQHRLVAELDGQVAGYLTYRRLAGSVVFIHTVVDDAYEGQGVGGALARFGLDQARREGWAVVPRCPFVAAWIERHPAYADLVAA